MPECLCHPDIELLNFTRNLIKLKEELDNSSIAGPEHFRLMCF